MSPQFWITNDFDKPDHKHLTIRKSDGLLYYVHPELEKWKGMNVSRPTPVEEFGVTCHNELGILHGALADESSRATYRDGRPRRWQGPERFSFIMNKHYNEAAQEALRAGDQSELTPTNNQQ